MTDKEKQGLYIIAKIAQELILNNKNNNSQIAKIYNIALNELNKGK